MAERVMVVCDLCGKAPAETVAITARDKNYRKDVCAEHLAELLKGARAPRRGRPARAPAASEPRRRGRPAKTKASGQTRSAAKAEPRRRGRKKITDPAILKKQRAALVKARQARAAKRAAAHAAEG